MSKQENEGGCLYLVATPIGNLEDITLRALRILQEVDVVAAEDTRHSRKLLAHYDIHRPLTSYYQHNLQEKGALLLRQMAAGKKVALISDAGMPGISDPGQDLVAKAIQADIPVIPIPGPTASLTALVISGLPSDRFVFEGFLPRKGKERAARLEALRGEPRTMLFYEAPHRLLSTLQDLRQHLGDREIVIARELSKKHEEVLRGTISTIYEHYANHEPKGEFTLVLAGQTAVLQGEEPDLEGVARMVLELEKAGLERKAAIKELAQKHGIAKRELYKAVLTALGKQE